MLTCPATVFSPAVQSNCELFRSDGQPCRQGEPSIR